MKIRMSFRLLLNLVENICTYADKNEISTGNTERRVEHLAKAHYAIDKIDLSQGGLEYNPELPIWLLYLRDFVAWTVYEFPEIYPDPLTIDTFRHLRESLVTECKENLASIGVHISEQQPDWREEAFKLYKSYRTAMIDIGAEETIESLNKAAETYLFRRFSDEE